MVNHFKLQNFKATEIRRMDNYRQFLLYGQTRSTYRNLPGMPPDIIETEKVHSIPRYQFAENPVSEDYNARFILDFSSKHPNFTTTSRTKCCTSIFNVTHLLLCARSG
jgi:hypothetical protein